MYLISRGCTLFRHNLTEQLPRSDKQLFLMFRFCLKYPQLIATAKCMVQNSCRKVHQNRHF